MSSNSEMPEKSPDWHHTAILGGKSTLGTDRVVIAADDLFNDDWDCCPSCNKPNQDHLTIAECCRELQYWKRQAELYQSLAVNLTKTAKEEDQ